jgi:hypothetical protein
MGEAWLRYIPHEVVDNNSKDPRPGGTTRRTEGCRIVAPKEASIRSKDLREGLESSIKDRL